VFNWLSLETQIDSDILFIYGDTFNQYTMLANSHRKSYTIHINDYIDSIKKGLIKRNYETILSALNEHEYPYKTGLFTYKRYGLESTTKSDICDFDYYVVSKRSYQPLFIQYELIIVNELLKNEWFKSVYENEEYVIIKNNNKGGDCIENQISITE